jgi:uncharacterized protein YgbK (DUF1537 family)
MTEPILDRSATFASLPPIWPHSLLDEIRSRVLASGQRLVVLDDDPTGGQTVHDLAVITSWEADLLDRELERSPVFYLLTNSRALDRAAAVAAAKAAGAAIRAAERRTGHQVVVASRSDSTLRGHFPAEIDALVATMTDSASGPAPGLIFAPYFSEGGRYTIDDVHYVLQGEQLVPAAQTEFARDPAFAYRHSHLPSWLEEATRGRVRASDILSITLTDLRLGGPQAVADKLCTAPHGAVVIVNAVADRDIEVFVTGLLDAEATGRRFFYRTAASFVRVRAGISSRPLLSPDELRAPGVTGGLIVVGSYTQRTTQQLEAALDLPNVRGVELQVDALLSPAEGNREHEDELSRLAAEVSSILEAGSDAILYTSRGLRAGATPEETMAIGRRISTAACTVVAALRVRPRFLVAKGGSTANDVATRGLSIRRAVVMGQIVPGVPVWKLGVESSQPGLCYVIFPGNVGAPDSLAQAIRQLSA